MSLGSDLNNLRHRICKANSRTLNRLIDLVSIKSFLCTILLSDVHIEGNFTMHTWIEQRFYNLFRMKKQNPKAINLLVKKPIRKELKMRR